MDDNNYSRKDASLRTCFRAGLSSLLVCPQDAYYQTLACSLPLRFGLSSIKLISWKKAAFLVRILADNYSCLPDTELREPMLLDVTQCAPYGGHS